MKRKRFMQVGTLVMSVMILMSGMPVYAQTDETQNVSENITSNTTVKTHLDSYFRVTLPKTINASISGGVLSDDYEIKVQGDIAGDELVNVVPDETFNLKQAGKDDIVINVAQGVTSADYSEIINEFTMNGTILGTGITAGNWNGVLHFNVSMGKMEPGLYDANGNMLRALTADDVERSYAYNSSMATSLGVDSSQVTRAIIPDDATSIGSEAFSYCANLTSVTIPNSVTSVGDYVFRNCENLTNVTIPNSVTSIGDGLFLGCTALTSVTLPDNVTSIKNSTFSNCPSLTNITIPSSVTSIEYRAFCGCTNLTNITIPDNVTSIENEAFLYCSGLTNITIQSNVASIGSKAFKDCTNLSSVTFGTTEGWYIGTAENRKATTLNSEDLANASTAATYLKSDYSGKYWIR